MDLKSKIRTIHDWPKEGIVFRDITSLLQDGDAFTHACEQFYERYRNKNLTKIVGIDARGFIFGPVLAYRLGIGFVPVRKPGKLPSDTLKESYSLEYGEGFLEIHKDAIHDNDRVIVMDDLIATGGTAKATVALIETLGGYVEECAFLIELGHLNGREQLGDCDIFSLVHYS